MQSNDNARRVALITGAASGIGASFATRFARANFEVILVDRKEALVKARADELTDRFGAKTHVIIEDLGKPGAAAAIRAHCQANALSIDVLVNNAGFHLNRFFHELPWSEIEENLQLLLTVVLELTHYFLPSMIERGWGRIINVASMSGFMPGGIRLVTYNAAKAFLVPFSEALNFELRSTGVHSTVVCPGFTRTDLFVDCGLTAVRDSVPGFMWIDPTKVANGGFRAAMGGHPLYIPHVVNRIIAAGSRLVPRRLIAARTRIFHRAEHVRLAALPRAVTSNDEWRRVALVTGATTGIGASFSDVLAAEGFDVILVGRRPEVVKQRAAQLTRRHAVRAYGIVQDLTHRQAGEAVLAECQALDLPIDVVVNNAGYPITELFHKMSWPDIDAALQIYIRSMVRLTHGVVGGMLARGRGNIINVASLAAFEPGSYRSSLYSSSKAFIVGFSESLAAELKGSGVSVTAICPGFTRTEWLTKNKLNNSSIPSFFWMDSDQVARKGFNAAMRGVPLCVVATFPLRAVSMMLHLAPRRIVGSLLSRKRRELAT